MRGLHSRCGISVDVGLDDDVDLGLRTACCRFWVLAALLPGVRDLLAFDFRTLRRPSSRRLAAGCIDESGSRLPAVQGCALAVLVMIFLVLPCAADEPSRAQQIVDAINDSKSKAVLIAAHRGGYANDREDGAPENSVANVAVAVSKGYDVYETDIQRTSDGVFVVVHDATLERETNGEGAVSTLTLAQVKQLQKRYRDGSLSEEKVATLEELLVAGRDTILFKADLKPGIIDHFDSLARLIDRMGMTDGVFLRTSIKDADKIAGAFANGTPKVEVMFKVAGLAGVRTVAKRFSPRTIQINFEKNETLDDEKRAAIRAAVELGMLVETHSYGDAAQWADLIDAGVRMFHTANPNATLSYLEKQGRRWREFQIKSQ